MRTQTAYERVVVSTRKGYEGGLRMPESGSYEADNCRYAKVMQMTRAGESKVQVVRRYPEFERQLDVLDVYRKIADGTVSEGAPIAQSSRRTDTADALLAAIIAGELDGESKEIIAERLGISVRQVEYYTRGALTQSKRRRKR